MKLSRKAIVGIAALALLLSAPFANAKYAISSYFLLNKAQPQDAEIKMLLKSLESCSPPRLERELALRLPHAHPCELEAYFEAAKLLR